MREDIEALVASLRRFKTPNSLAEQRANYDLAAVTFPLPEGASFEPWRSGDLHGELVTPRRSDPRKTILFLHGGGYVMGSPRSHRHLAAAIAEAAGAVAVVLDYRLAPEHPFPAAFDDAVAAWLAITKSAEDGDVFAIAGDSAGGGLSLACAAALSAIPNARSPVALSCVSPWTDLSLEDARPDSDADPMMKLALNSHYARAYLGSVDPKDPRASAIHADLSGLPPAYLLVGSTEQIRSDSDRIVQVARGSKVDIELEVTEGAPHVWPWFWPRCGASLEATRKMGEFLGGHLTRAQQMRATAH